VNKILVKETNWLGDIIMSMPALRAVRRHFPDAHLAVLVKDNLAAIFNDSPIVDEVIPYRFRRGLGGVGDRFRVGRTLKAKGFDAAVLFPNSLDAAIVAFLARIPRRVGYARDGRSLLLTDRVRASREILEVHQARYYLNLVTVLGVESDDTDAGLWVAPPARERMLQYLRKNGVADGAKLVAFAAGAAYGPAKEWGRERFARLAARLTAGHGVRIILVGAPRERADADRLFQQIGNDALNAVGETALDELVALLSMCTAFVGNDSGAMHVAGALGIPTVGIFGSTRPDRTGPLGAQSTFLKSDVECAPCLKRVCASGDYRCMESITVTMVEDALKELGAFSP